MSYIGSQLNYVVKTNPVYPDISVFVNRLMVNVSVYIYHLWTNCALLFVYFILYSYDGPSWSWSYDS